MRDRCLLLFGCLFILKVSQGFLNKCSPTQMWEPFLVQIASSHTLQKRPAVNLQEKGGQGRWAFLGEGLGAEPDVCRPQWVAEKSYGPSLPLQLTKMHSFHSGHNACLFHEGGKRLWLLRPLSLLPLSPSCWVSHINFWILQLDRFLSLCLFPLLCLRSGPQTWLTSYIKNLADVYILKKYIDSWT